MLSSRCKQTDVTGHDSPGPYASQPQRLCLAICEYIPKTKATSTLPWTVPSPAEKRGGLGKGLTTLSRKTKQIVTKTSTKGTLLNLGEGGPPGESTTPCSESRKETTSPIPFLSSKKISKIGTWNVRTMFEANKAGQIARE